LPKRHKYYLCNKPKDGTPARRLLASSRLSARTNKRAPMRAKFLIKNWKSHNMLYAKVYKTKHFINRRCVFIISTTHLKLTRSNDLTSTGIVSTCSTTIEKRTPHAMSTLNLHSTMTQPPSWPTKIIHHQQLLIKFSSIKTATLHYLSLHTLPYQIS